MLATMAWMAALIGDCVGLALWRSAWLNLDRPWTLALCRNRHRYWRDRELEPDPTSARVGEPSRSLLRQRAPIVAAYLARRLGPATAA
jgi:hypothetical protein